jgi:arylsulfotransferase ASST
MLQTMRSVQAMLERARAAAKSVLRFGGPLLAAAVIAGLLGGCGAGSATVSAVLSAQVSPASAAANPVAVSPLAGTADAPPSTQISFLGRVGTRVLAVRVVGSRSGVHQGVLRVYSTRTGASFLPAHAFAVGERVSVRARLSIAGARSSASTTFTVAAEAAVDQNEFPLNPGDSHAVQHYASAPTLTPSTVRITTPAAASASPGDLFLAPYQGRGTPGPMIADQSGNLVWFHPLAPGEEATNFAVQHYEGKPVLVWWQGRILRIGFGQGEDVIYDSSYRRLATVRAGNGYHADLHEIRITPEGTAWIDAFEPTRMNLSALHGAANGMITDSVVQEIDIKTGLVMWEWHALGHIPVEESKNPLPGSSNPWDYAHLNSADPGSTGDVLVSVRNTWTLYDIDIRSGDIRWQLGGSHSSFRLGPGSRFYWQHDAQFQPGGLISLFDNGSDPPKERQSRGLLLRADAAAHTVSVLGQFANPSRTLLAESQGSATSLPAGNWLIGYGQLPDFTEFDSSGHVLLDGTLGRNVQDFKTFLAPWSAQPTSAPSVLAKPQGAGSIAVSVSWNGATEVASWRVLAGSSATSLAPVAVATKTGFETTIDALTSQPYVAVQALDRSGAVIGASPAVRP